MDIHNLISVNDFCTNHHIEVSFVSSLKQVGLIDIVWVEEQPYVDNNQVCQLEKIVRFYYEMDINLEGIETILHLLQRMENMQDEINHLKNRLSLYE